MKAVTEWKAGQDYLPPAVPEAGEGQPVPGELASLMEDIVVMGDESPVDTNPHQPVYEGFVIDSDEKLEWLLRKMGSLEAEKAGIKARAEEMQRGLDAQVRRLQARFEDEVETYVRRRLAETRARGKTYRTLQGHVMLKREPEQVKIVDPGALSHVLEDLGRLGEFQTPRLDTAAVKQWVLSGRAAALSEAEQHDGEVPESLAFYLALPGVE